jgi:hypothetical protein
MMAGAVLVGAAAISLATLGSTAAASTLDGIATIASPGTTTYLSGGGSTTNFTVSLPPQAACTGDSAHDGYHVYSYLVQKGTNVANITFPDNAPNSADGQYGLVEPDGTYWGNKNNAPNTGQIIEIPNDFEWGPLVSEDNVPLNTLLYQNDNTSGVWEAGLACAPGSGVVSDYWNTEVTFSANGSDPTGFVWSAVPGPSGSTPAAFTSANATTFVEGQSGSFTPTASGSPTPTITESGTLPAGVTFTGGSLTGTPTADGTFHITLTATNGIESPATQSFTLTVDGPPTITSANNATFVAGAGGSFTVTTTGVPTPSLSESGSLPSGVTFNDNGNGTGTLAGTPAAGTAGTYQITFGASNGQSPPASQTFTLTVDPTPAPPTITSANNTSFLVGSSGTFTVTTTGVPTPSLSVSGTLPSGVAFNDNGNGTGTLAGTPAAGTAGTYVITIGASNGQNPPASQSFTLTVDAPPTITSANSANFSVGSSGSFTVTTTGVPAPSLTETGSLPSGVTFTDNGNGTAILDGTPGAGTGGTYSITISASNGVSPAASQSFTLYVGLQITTTSLPAATVGQKYSVTLGGTGGTQPYAWSAKGLPQDVKLAKDGTFKGRPDKKDGSQTFNVTLTLKDSAKPKDVTRAVLSITVNPA